MAVSLLAPLTSRYALLSKLHFGQGRGAAQSVNCILSRRPAITILAIFLHPIFRPQSLSFSSTAVTRGGSSRSLVPENLVVLGIETSCDDTAAAVVSGNGEILSQIVSSQADLLSRYGGVAPKMAEEAHSLVIDQVVQQALDNSSLTGEDLSAVAVTIGPGLSLCLRVGVTKARSVAGRFNLPFIGVHHMEAHTLVARCVDNNLISSASSHERKLRADIAASFQRVAVLHLEERCERAIEWAKEMEPSIKCLVVSGGVASNQYVRSRLNNVVEKNGISLVCPPPNLCTDNGVMVAWTGIEHFIRGRFDPPPPAFDPEDYMCDLRPRWPLGEEYLRGKSEARSLKSARMHPSLTSIIQSSIKQQI